MRYVRLGIPIFLALLVLIGCPRRQVVQPTEEVVVEEVPEEVIIEEPAKPPFMVQRIFFDFDKSDIRADAAEILKKNAQMLELYPEVTIVIEGHCCEIGTAEYNLALGERRAKAAQDYLLMLGVTPARFSTISYGEERPFDPEILERNRRCEFRSE
ncbi:MAG: OmpA family protein [candidate division WOR-3 bacterium]|nr:MAG: OmpA family protein [candidate division WOR-3 bacterium]